ncbi:MAG: hypothetical protein KDA92_18045, partial [Planctomycetales bacterium]|nr:hypothetical protein [Planctomycetales bacterium]
MTTFQPMGPAPIIHGQIEKVTPDNEVSGALHTVVAHPTNANILYAGSVNGGVWKTTNAQATSPHWVPLTDSLPSQSVTAMSMDPTNPNRLVVGMGNASSFGLGGALTGLILTENGGATWKQIKDPLLVGKNISGLAINGDLIIASAGGGFFFSDQTPDGGLFRSTDGGDTWESIELVARDTNFPDEAIPFATFDLVADPSDPLRYYAAVGGLGVFRTEDGGENWTNVTAGDAQIDAIFQFAVNNGLDQNNMEMAVASNGRVYLAVIVANQPVYLGYSDDGAWTQTDLPMTVEATGIAGLSPRQKAGGQGFIHFSIAADPTDPYTFYVAGDRQDGDMSFDSGNSIGAHNFSARIFRGNTRKAAVGNILNVNAATFVFNGYSPQWDHMTHSNQVPEMPNGGTRRGSAPHADSREMVFDAAGNLIEVDDGGIYKRTSPRTNQGDWYSINGDLQVTEIHDIAYDTVSNVLVSGTQDNGSIQQLTAGSMVWEQISTERQSISFIVTSRANGDGGDVAVDDSGDG